MASSPAAWAGPSGLTVTSGQAAVSSPNPQTTVIQQSTNKAVLNWNSFSIGSNETVRFQQPGSSSIAVNRVTGGQASSILGSLVANGQVWLVNPNGIMFGRGATVNLAGLIATTSDIRDSDFLAGNYNFGIASPNPNAGIINQGTIQAATGGSVVLSGAYVRNDGLIQANLGKVAVGGATTFAVSFNGDSLLSYAVTGSVTQAPVDQNGHPVTALVTNTGSIVADGGQVTLTARAAKNILDNVINTTGIIEANTASMVNGTVVLDAGDGGVAVGGTLSATGLNSGETGGTVKVLGGAVTVASGATINASGDAGGGSVYVGGEFHGAGPDPNALTTDVQQGAAILADAVTSGNGGNVAVWADGFTAFDGTISAHGGALGGNGGFVETSGKQGLSVQTGTVNTLAPNGQVGTWLLDPTNITVVASGGTATLAQDSSFGSGGTNDTLNASSITGAGSNVNLQATQNITFNTAVNITSGINLFAQAGGSINVNANITTNGSNIKLSANDSGGPATGSGGIAIASGVGLSTNASGATGGTIELLVNGGTGSIVDSNTGGASLKTAGGTVKLTTTGTGDVSLSGGINTVGTAAVTSGAVVIGAGGNVTIGSGMSLGTVYSGSALSSTANSINASGLNTATTTNTPGNGGSVAISGASINLPFGIVTRGGDSTNANTSGSAPLAWTGSGAALTANGGNAGSISLQATNGDVVVGSNSVGDVVGLIARGGDSTGGSGGTGANVSITGTAISIGGKILTRGGDTTGTTAGLSGGNAGSIALAATGTDTTNQLGAGHSIRLFGTSDSPIDTTGTTIIGDITSRGGQIGTQLFSLTGSVTGAGGNITMAGANGGALQGDILLQTGTATSVNGGSTVSISAGGGSSGGSITVNGSINAATSNVESLRLTAGNGSATVTGGIGTATALNSVVFGTGLHDLPAGSNGGAMTINGPVTVGTQIQDLRGSGSLTFNGLITTPLLKMPDNTATAVAMNGGGVFSGDLKTGSGNTLTIAGNFLFTSSFSGNLSGPNPPSFNLKGPAGFDSSALNASLVANNISGNFPLTIYTGSGNATVASASGTKFVLRGSGTYTINNASGVSFDFSGLSSSARAYLNGTKVFPLPSLNAVLPPPPPVTPTLLAPPPAPISPLPIMVPIAPVANLGPGGALAASPTSASANAPQTVEETDTGGSMFSQISAPGSGTASASSSGGSTSTTTASTSGTDNGGGSSSGSSSSSSSGSSNSSGPTTASGGTRGSGSTAAASGSTAANTTTSNTAAPPSDASDRALSVIASPPPVQPVSHALPAPPRVTTAVVPGYVNQVQHPPVPKQGTPGIQQNYSASGNSGRW